MTQQLSLRARESSADLLDQTARRSSHCTAKGATCRGFLSFSFSLMSQPQMQKAVSKLEIGYAYRKRRVQR
jgi:hypothetical protein